MSNAYINAIRSRRSQYALGKDLPLAQTEVTALIQEAVKLSPSSFNSQSSRAVILYGAQSEKFWGFVKEALGKVVPADAFAPTEAKINSFAAGAGTVLFYEDQDVIAGLQKQFAAYADNFPVWSEQASGIAQFSVWTALANAGIGGSLQHYNPLPDAAVAAEWHIPASWKLRAQLPFGSNQGGFGEKAFIDDAERFRVFA
ncbi:MAG: nitroreductase family protein [Comamonas sp.]